MGEAGGEDVLRYLERVRMCTEGRERVRNGLVNRGWLGAILLYDLRRGILLGDPVMIPGHVAWHGMSLCVMHVHKRIPSVGALWESCALDLRGFA